MKNRRDFLKTACKPIVLATLGIPLIEACSNEEDQPEMNSSSVNNNQTTQDNSSSELEINLDDNKFGHHLEAESCLFRRRRRENFFEACGLCETSMRNLGTLFHYNWKLKILEFRVSPTFLIQDVTKISSS